MNSKQSDDKNISWLTYERCVAALKVAENSDIDVTVLPNVMLMGKISETRRQVDVLIDARWGNENSRRTIVDAKYRSRKVNVKDVEALEGMMRDCGAVRGVIVSNIGFTKAAIKRAEEAITITTLTLEALEDFEWVYEPCLGLCDSKKAKTRGMVLWGAFAMGYLSSPEDPALIIQTAKCDGCHSFHVWCWGCGTKFPVVDGSLHICDCELAWIAYPDADKSSMQLGIVIDKEYARIVDRRPLK